MFVLDAAVRSFPPVDPVALRWSFPLWLPDGAADPAKLKGKLTRGEQRQGDQDREAREVVIAALAEGGATARQLRAKTGYGKYRQDRILDQLTASGEVVIQEATIKGTTYREYQLNK
jgi:hypothetical protein